MLTLAAEVLAGELAARRGEADAAVRHLAEAVRIQDGHWFTEPPPWYFPVRQSLGAVLLSRPAAPPRRKPCIARTCAAIPRTAGRSSASRRALRAQGKNDEAATADARFRRAWARADVTLTASRF